MDTFETEAFKAYDEKFKAIVTATDAATIKRLEAEAALLKIALVEAEAKRCGYAARPNIG